MKVHIYFEILSIKEVEKVGSYKWSNLMGKSSNAICHFFEYLLPNSANFQT